MMNRVFYPESERVLFTNRETELKTMDFYLDEFLKKRKENISIFGLRRIGKTIFIKEFMRRHEEMKFIRLNFEFLFSVPVEFSQNLILESGRGYFNKELELYDLLSLPGGEVVKKLLQETEKREPSKTELMKLPLEYLVCLGREEKIVVFMDEFQEILKLKNYRELKNILGIFREYINSENILFVISGSFPHIIKDMIANGESPLYNQFKELKMDFFERESSCGLISKIIECDEKSKDLIHKLTGGHPFYIVSLANRIKLIHELYELPINSSTIKRAFLIETLHSEGSIYKHCAYLLNTVMSLAKYKAPLIATLNSILQKEGATQSEIAKKIKVSQGEARLYISELEKLDVLKKIENGYYFVDDVFKIWLDLRKTCELGNNPADTAIEKYIKILEQKYLRVCTKLGIAKESEVRENLHKIYKIKFKSYLKDNIEFDGVCIEDNVVNILEIKWRNKPSDYEDVENFLKKTEKSEFRDKEKKLFFVSKSGFTSSALKLAKSDNIILLDKNLEEIN